MHLEVEVCKIYLAHAYGFVSRIEEAKTILQGAIKNLSQIVGNTSNLVALGICFLGELSRITGNYSDAKSLFSVSFNLFSQLFGDNHPDVARVMVETPP